MQPSDGDPSLPPGAEATTPPRPPIGSAAPRNPFVLRPFAAGLSHGELSEADARQLRELKDQIRRRVGFSCDGYKERCLRRRIGVRMRARGVHGYADYGALLETDPAEYQRLLDAVTINVSKFFRNADVWEMIRERVIPRLFELNVPFVNIWSAGSAAGEEAYTVAILLLEHAQEHGLDLSRFRIVGTDIDTETLAAAKKAEYSPFAFGEIDDATRARWFEGESLSRLKPEVRRMVRFGELDLMSGPMPPNQHLILCRNVVIYFERAVQDDIFRRFHGSLARGGFLVLGKVEALFGDTSALFDVISTRHRIFTRP
jgi:chemotaxis methyl-accepting protein methylase